jgi:transcriptional regulator with XRE-family HTH domain
MVLADLAGTHYNYVGALERGQVNPTFETLLALCTALEVTPGELFTLYDVRLVEIAAREA